MPGENKIINKLDFFPNDNNSNPLSFTFKDNNNDNKNASKETGKFKNFEDDDNNDDDDKNDYPSFSEL